MKVQTKYTSTIAKNVADLHEDLNQKCVDIADTLGIKTVRAESLAEDSACLQKFDNHSKCFVSFSLLPTESPKRETLQRYKLCFLSTNHLHNIITITTSDVQLHITVFYSLN
jgi:hypothetical protein